MSRHGENLCECGAPLLSGGHVGMYCSNKDCPVENALIRQAIVMSLSGEDGDNDIEAAGEMKWWMWFGVILVPFSLAYFYVRHWLSGRTWP